MTVTPAGGFPVTGSYSLGQFDDAPATPTHRWTAVDTVELIATAAAGDDGDFSVGSSLPSSTVTAALNEGHTHMLRGTTPGAVIPDDIYYLDKGVWIATGFRTTASITTAQHSHERSLTMDAATVAQAIADQFVTLPSSPSSVDTIEIKLVGHGLKLLGIDYGFDTATNRILFTGFDLATELFASDRGVITWEVAI